MTKDPRFTLTRRQAFGLLGLGGAAAATAYHSSSVDAAAEPAHELQRRSFTGGAILTNATPYQLMFQLNNGAPKVLYPFSGPSVSVGPIGTSGTAYGVLRSANPQADAFTTGAYGNQSSLRVSTGGNGGPNAYYLITVNTPLGNNIYLWVFLDEVIGIDQTGSRQGIQVQRT